jgi:hypothetical protein
MEFSVIGSLLHEPEMSQLTLHGALGFIIEASGGVL